jgi:membrane protein required for colicin V production
VIAAWLVGSLLGYLVQRSGLTLGLDRLLGGVFGLVRGAVIIGFVVMLADAAGMRSEDWWKGSRMIPVGEEMASILRGYVETGRRAVEDVTEANT